MDSTAVFQTLEQRNYILLIQNITTDGVNKVVDVAYYCYHTFQRTKTRSTSGIDNHKADLESDLGCTLLCIFSVDCFKTKNSGPAHTLGPTLDYG